MIYECNLCQKLLYLEEDFVDHINSVHLEGVDDEITVMSEMMALYTDLQKVRKNEDMLQLEPNSATEERIFPTKKEIIMAIKSRNWCSQNEVNSRTNSRLSNQ